MKSWLSSPLAINYLLSLCKNDSSYQKKYLQIFKDLKLKDGFKNSNAIFVSPSYNVGKQYDISDINVEMVEFGKNHDASECIMKWINQYEGFSGINLDKHVTPSITSLLCNISVYQDVWKCNQPSAVMKVHNSFSYTEDIKYEARLLELPMRDDDFKLVLIVPNEVSSICNLFNKLVEGGLTAAVGCIQPLFTFSTVLEAPNIEFRSENNSYFTEVGDNCDAFNCVQIGNVQINERGTNISALTLLSSTSDKSTVSVDEEQLDTPAPFYFAVLYKNIAVFSGRYVKRR